MEVVFNWHITIKIKTLTFKSVLYRIFIYLIFNYLQFILKLFSFILNKVLHISK